MSASPSHVAHVDNICPDGWKGKIFACMVNWCEYHVDNLIDIILVNWPCFVLHLVLLISYEVLRAFKGHPTIGPIVKYNLVKWLHFPRVLRCWLTCVCVLNFYYLKPAFWSKTPGPFTTSVLFISLDSIVFLLVGKGTKDSLDEDADEKSKTRPAPAAQNRYAMFSHPFEEAVFFFIVQILLMVFFVNYMNDNADINAETEPEVNLSRWISGFMLSVAAAKVKGGKEYDEKMWAAAYERMGKLPAPVASARCRLPVRIEWGIRNFFDILINGIFRQVLLCTVPVLVVTTQPNKFMGSLVAFMFVVKLDDTGSTPVDKEIDIYVEDCMGGAAADEPETGTAKPLLDAEAGGGAARAETAPAGAKS